MDSSYMNTGQMNSDSSCSCNQARRMGDSRRGGNMRRSDESGRMEERRRMNDGRCMDERRCMNEGRCMNERRCMEESSCMGKSELCEKTDGLALAMAYVPWQCYQDTFDLRKGLHVGTIFPELCKPFCGKRGVCQC